MPKESKRESKFELVLSVLCLFLMCVALIADSYLSANSLKQAYQKFGTGDEKTIAEAAWVELNVHQQWAHSTFVRMKVIPDLTFDTLPPKPISELGWYLIAIYSNGCEELPTPHTYFTVQLRDTNKVLDQVQLNPLERLHAQLFQSETKVGGIVFRSTVEYKDYCYTPQVEFSLK